MPEGSKSRSFKYLKYFRNNRLYSSKFWPILNRIYKIYDQRVTDDRKKYNIFFLNSQN